MSVVIDDKGRIDIPSKLRKKLKLKKGDAFIIVEVNNDLLVLKRIDVERLAREIAEEIAKSHLDLEELGRRVENEANGLAEEKVDC